MKSINKILKERGNNYGDYKGGSQFRVNIMNLIKQRHIDANNKPLDPLYEVYIFDIINKLSRLAATPTHLDSWVDIAGYATLISKEVKKDADK